MENKALQVYSFCETIEKDIQEENLEIVKNAIDKNEILPKDLLVNILLHFAARCSAIDVCKLLMDEKKADVNFLASNPNRARDSPVYPLESCMNSRSRNVEKTIECAKLLVSRGANSESKNNCLLYAARQGNLPFLELLVNTKIESSEVNLNHCDAHLNSPLLLTAFHSSSKECLSFLLNNGANINHRNAQGNTALHQVVARPGKESQECIEVLLEKGIDVMATNNQGDTPLIKAVRQGNAGAVKVLTNKLSLDQINFANQKGLTAVHEASIWGQTEILSILLDKGADINCQDPNGNSPLHLACDRRIIGANSPIANKVEQIPVLINRGANIELLNNLGETPFLNVHVPIEKLLLLIESKANKEAKDNKGETALLKAVRSGAIQHVDRLIKAGCDMACINELDTLLDDKGNTILHKALSMEYEYFDTFALLLNKTKFSINTPNAEGDTLLHVIARNDLSEYLSLVLSRQPDIGVRNKEGQSPLDIAVQNGSAQLVVELVEASNRNVDFEPIKTYRDDEGNSLLHRAVNANSEKAVRSLIQYGLNPDTPNTEMDSYSDGGSPLHLAAQKEMFEIVNLLIELGADINNKHNYYGNTPLHVAARFGNEEMVKHLLDKGADRSVLNNDEETALQCAEYAESEACIKLLQ